MKLIALPLLVLLTPSTSLTIPPQLTFLPSSNLATPLLHSWLTAFNTINATEIQTFYKTSFGPFPTSQNDTSSNDVSICFSLPRSPCQDIHMSNWTGGFSLVDLESTPSNAELTVLLQEKHHSRYFRASIAVDSNDSQSEDIRITKLELRPIMTPLRMIPKSDARRPIYEKGMQPLTNQLRAKIVKEMSTVLREKYVDPVQGEALASIIEENLQKGQYDVFEESEAFSYRLSEDLNDDWNRSRNGGFYDPFVSFNEPLPRRDEEEEKWDRQKYYKEFGYGFGDVVFDDEAIEGKTIATLPITQLFNFSEGGIPVVVVEKMNSISDADVLILDLRNCFGVDTQTAAFILSHLFDQSVLLTDLVDRAEVRHLITTLPVGLGVNVFGRQKPVYVLTNNRTAFEAEEIAYSLQAYGRAKVIGEHETTMGWASPAPVPHPICEEEFGEGWWSVYARDMKLVHHVTGSSWDGVGVKSDILAGWEEGSDRAREAAIALERNKGREVQEEL